MKHSLSSKVGTFRERSSFLRDAKNELFEHQLKKNFPESLFRNISKFSDDNSPIFRNFCIQRYYA